MAGIGRVEGEPRFPREQIEKAALRVVKASEITFSDVKQMAAIVGATAGISEDDYVDSPCLEHPLGVTIKFSEGADLIRNPFPLTTISFKPAISTDIGENNRTQIADVVLRGMFVELFDDSIVLNSSGIVLKGHKETDVVDKFTLTRDSYKSERTPLSRMY